MRFYGVILGLALLLCLPASAHAQAYVDQPGTINTSFSYTYGPSGKIVAPDNEDSGISGTLPGVPMHIHIFEVSGQYVTPLEGLAVEASLPVIASKLGGDSFQHFPEPGPYDDGDVHFAATDFRAGVRYQIKQIQQQLGLAFVLAGSVPTWDYPTNGLTAPGRGLMGLHLGVDVARTLEPILPKAFFQVGYEFTLRERVKVDSATEKFNRNRSDLVASIGYFLPKDFYAALSGHLGYNHGGVGFNTIVLQPPSVQLHHDRLLRERYILAGGDIGYIISDALSLALSGRKFVWGEDTRNQNLIAFTASYRIR